MPNEVHNKIIVAEGALDFDTAFAEIDSLPALDMCWCAPLSDAGWDDAEWAEIFVAISAGTSPVGAAEFYWGRAGSNLRTAEGFGNTLTDHGTEGTTADVEDMIRCLSFIDSIPQAVSDVVYTKTLWVPNPGNGSQLFIHNNTGVALDGTGSPHSAYARGWAPEVQ